MIKERILLIDQPIHALRISSELLKQKQFVLAGVANTLQQAREKLEECQAGLVLLDPQIFSQQERDELLNLLKSKNIPWIIHSSHRSPDLPQTPYIPKIQNQQELVAQITAGLKKLKQSASPNKISAREIPRTERESDRALKIMLVDDSALMKLLLNQEVLKQDQRIQLIAHASNGQEAIEILQTLTPDVILLDLEMPVMDGISFLRAIQGQHQAQI